jgi:hypothetical protein
MDFLALLVPLLYSALVVAICVYLLTRGFTHAFLLLFALAAILHAIPSVGFYAMQQAPGGFGANARWLPGLRLISFFGTVASAAAFLLLAKFVLRTSPPAVQG